MAFATYGKYHSFIILFLLWYRRRSQYPSQSMRHLNQSDNVPFSGYKHDLETCSFCSLLRLSKSWDMTWALQRCHTIKLFNSCVPVSIITPCSLTSMQKETHAAKESEKSSIQTHTVDNRHYISVVLQQEVVSVFVFLWF